MSVYPFMTEMEISRLLYPMPSRSFPWQAYTVITMRSTTWTRSGNTQTSFGVLPILTARPWEMYISAAAVWIHPRSLRRGDRFRAGGEDHFNGESSINTEISVAESSQAAEGTGEDGESISGASGDSLQFGPRIGPFFERKFRKPCSFFYRKNNTSLCRNHSPGGDHHQSPGFSSRNC